MERHLESLESDAKCFADENDVEEPPNSLLWVLYFLAQHYVYVGRLVSACLFFLMLRESVAAAAHLVITQET